LFFKPMIFLGAAIVLLSAHLPAIAGQTIKNQSKTSETLETVTVTAQKREENLKDVPISMDVFSGIQIEDAGIEDLAELIHYCPNLFSKPSMDNRTIIIRGVSSINTALSPPASIFVDDISYPLNRMQNPDLIDIERIEVLRGPQGTLYGKNTMSGAIKIITKQPDNVFRAKIFGEYGYYDTPDDNVPLYRAGGSISAPLKTDTLFMNVAFQTEDSDGYMKNIYNGNAQAAETDHKYGKVHLRWTPTEQWDISFIANLAENNDGYGKSRYESGQGATDRYEINWNGGNYWKEENNNQVIRAKYRGTAFDVLSISSRSDYCARITNDADFGPFNFQNQNFLFDITSLSQEIRLSSSDGWGKISWVGGVFVSRDDTTANSETLSFNYDRNTEIESESIAVFGQGTYSPYDRLHLTLGLRYEHLESNGEQANAFGATPWYCASNSDDEFLPKASVSFDVTKDVMTYATVARGFLSGGYNFHYADNADDLAFDPEHLTSYEAGIKAMILDEKLVLNLAVFHLDIQDKQVKVWPVGELPTARDLTNAAEASSNGIEVEIQARPITGLAMFAGFGYTDSRFDNWIAEQSTGTVYNYNDKYLPNVPRYTYNAGIQYRSPGGLFMRTDIFGTGRYYTDSENTQEVGGYETVNMKIGYEWEHCDIALWAKNIFDKAYVIDRGNYFGSMVSDGDPRRLGITLTYRF